MLRKVDVGFHLRSTQSTRLSVLPMGMNLVWGAEIGISTDKLHAKGPMGLTELTSYKFVIFGNGQIRG
ncbi:MAG: hypothetical protein E3K37_05965 [Candidatus Kuenenia sp.]|nr:hypothetical protein [Candidatus Kuenenia hertensis]